jgi:hypothetical protein
MARNTIIGSILPLSDYGGVSRVDLPNHHTFCFSSAFKGFEEFTVTEFVLVGFTTSHILQQFDDKPTSPILAISQNPLSLGIVDPEQLPAIL